MCAMMRTAGEMGIETVAVASEPGRLSLAARTADQSVVIGPAPASASYLNHEAVIQAGPKPGTVGMESSRCRRLSGEPGRQSPIPTRPEGPP